MLINTLNYKCHESADIDKAAIIGRNCQIWNWTKIREKAIVGESTKIGQCCYVDLEVKIGKNCKIQNGVQIYKGVTIEDNVFIGPNVVFSNDKYPRALNEDWKITPTRVEDNVSIGAGAVIVCGVELGAYSMIAAGAVVTQSVPKYGLVMGNPARLYGYVDEYGRTIERIG